MSAARKRITIVAGVGAFIVVLAVIALNWRRAYYWFVPEARFWGTWEVVAGDDAPVFVGVSIVFRRDGSVTSKTNGPSNLGNKMTWRLEINHGQPVSSPLAPAAFFVLTPWTTYGVSRTRVTFEGLRDLSQGSSVVCVAYPDGSSEARFSGSGYRSAIAAYRFGDSENVRLTFDSDLFGDDVWTLRRLPETGDADE